MEQQNEQTEEKEFKPVTHVIFDMDGLLLGTEDLYTKVFNQVANRYGKEFTWEHKIKTMGMQTDEAARTIIGLLELPMSIDEFKAETEAAYKRIFPEETEPLPDTEDIYAKIFRIILSKFGHVYSSEIRCRVMGSPFFDCAVILISHYKLPINVSQLREHYVELENDLFVDVDFMPGAVELLRNLHKQNVPFCLATSSSKASYDLKTTKVQELFELFHHKVLGTSDPEVKRGKPFPDIFIVAASRFPDNPDPSKCLVFEDAPNGVQAALAAGMQVVHVPHQSLPKEYTKSATLALDSLKDFNPEVFGLPAFTKSTSV